MKISISNSLGMAAALFLSACMAKQEPPPIADFASWEDIAPQSTMIQLSPESGPVDINVVLSSEENLRSSLDTLFPEFAAIGNLKDRIDRIQNPEYALKSADDYDEDEDEQSPVLSGLGGVIADAFLNAARATLDPDGKFDDGKRVYEFVYGQIQDFTYNDGDGSGSFNTTTYYTTVTVPDGPSPIISTTDAYRWAIKVGAGGFTVVPKSNRNPRDPFPNTMIFDRAMLNRVNFLGFQYKLWAEGTIIDIVDVELKAHGTPDFVRLNDSDWRYRRTRENCIDMLFVSYPPPNKGTLEPPLYCLGRCETPQLVNTGL